MIFIKLWDYRVVIALSLECVQHDSKANKYYFDETSKIIQISYQIFCNPFNINLFVESLFKYCQVPVASLYSASVLISSNNIIYCVLLLWHVFWKLTIFSCNIDLLNKDILTSWKISFQIIVIGLDLVIDWVLVHLLFIELLTVYIQNGLKLIDYSINIWLWSALFTLSFFI